MRFLSRWSLLCVSVAVLLAGCPEPDPPSDDDDDDTADDDSGDDDDSGSAGADDDDSSAGDDDTAAEVVTWVCADGSGDFLTIQEGIDAAEPGTTVEVCPGIYDEDLVLEGKGLTVRSTDGSTSTVIQGSGTATVWQVRDTGDHPAAIEGFAIQGGLSEADGGGIHCDGAVLDVSACFFTGNVGGFGGGVGASACEITLTGSMLTGNHATYGGGAVYYDECEGEISGCYISGNVAGHGGGIGVDDGIVTISDNQISGNEADDSGDLDGGGGIWAYGSIDIIGNTVTGNESDKYAGGVFALGGDGDILDNEIADNESSNDGGGMYAYTSSAWISGNLITGNSSGDDAGGLRVRAGSAVIEDNTLSFNTCSQDGGATKFSHAANTFQRNLIEGNVAGDDGGGVELDNDNTSILDCTFLDNTADAGAGLHSSASFEEIWIQDSTFQGNVATECGGAIEIEDDSDPVHLVHLLIQDNEAPRGAGLCASDSTVAVASSIFTGNVASSEGGGIYLYEVAGTLTNVVISANASPTGSGLRMNDAEGLAVTNTIITDNTEGYGVALASHAPDQWAYNNVFGNPSGDFSGLDDPTGLDGNLSLDPRFVDTAAGDYHLQGNSPCIDTGDPNYLDGDGTLSDMGAFGGPYGSWP